LQPGRSVRYEPEDFDRGAQDAGHATFNGLDGSFDMDLARLVGLPGTDCSLLD
jgi:hypothetical protein